MKIKIFLLILTATLAITSCRGGKKPLQQKSIILSDVKNAPGDSSIYCLACDGCSDTVAVVLQMDGTDPDTLYLLDAMRKNMVFGRPKIGDNLAIMVDKNNKKKVTMLVDINDFIGEWGYMVNPTLKKRVSTADVPMPQDTSTEKTIKDLLKPVEYSFKLNSDHTARTTGFMKFSTTSDDQSPVTYPERRHYASWRMFNCKLILTSGGFSLAGKKVPAVDDTCDICLIMKDSFELGGGGIKRGYYRIKKK